jgi:RNA polymerase sigma factor (sigma-70 family)
MAKSLTISELVEQCRAEAARYQQTRQSDQTDCFELFRRALAEGDEVAWAAIYAQYENLVAKWVQAYLARLSLDASAEDFVNEAFARLWRYGTISETAEQLDELGKCLSYLKKCAWSAIEDHRRWQEKDALSRGEELGNYWNLAGNEVVPEDQVAKDEMLAQLREVLAKIIQTEQECLVAEESWIYNQPPRQIQACYPEHFASVKEVRQIKHNLLKRLKRSLNHS